MDEFLEQNRMAQKERKLKKIRKRLEKDLKKAFQIQGDKFMKRFEKYKNKFQEADEQDDVNRTFELVLSETIGLFSKPINDAIEEALLTGGKELFTEMDMDIDFNLSNPRAQEYINKHGAELVSGVSNTTKKRINYVVSKGMEKGWSYDETAKALKQRWKKFAVGMPQKHIRSRAHLISVTEVGQAYEFGARESVKQMQERAMPMEKKWQTVGDNRVSEGCATNEAEGWIDVDQTHNSGHMHPLRFPGCRCTELYRRKRDV